MTELLDRAVRAMRNLPPSEQDEIAGIMLRLAGADEEPLALSPEEHEAISRSEAAAARGEFATDAQVQAVWARHRI